MDPAHSYFPAEIFDCEVAVFHIPMYHINDFRNKFVTAVPHLDLVPFLGDDNVQLVAASESAAEQAAEMLRAAGKTGGSGKLRLFTSGDAQELYDFASVLLGEKELDITALPPMEVLAE